jgi:hypothetical protein
MMNTDYWQNCYDQSWKGIIVDAAMAHPAKYSRGLITRIIAHALAEGMIQPGGVVLDPFAGQGGGALPCLQAGLHYIGIELEPRFVELGQGSDCSGISKEDWVRFYGRWSKGSDLEQRYNLPELLKNPEHFCPDCITAAGQVYGDPPDKPKSIAQAHRRKRIAALAKKHDRPVRLYPALPLPGTPAARPQLNLFGQSADAGYRRNSGIIPATGPHRFAGNIERWQKIYPHLSGSAQIIQGDSRRLAEVVAAAGCVVDSPPYAETPIAGFNAGVKASGGLGKQYKLGNNPGGSQQVGDIGYGHTPGQLAALPPGTPPAIISSPPFAGNSGGRGEASRQGIDAALFDRHSGGMIGGMGDEPGNLGNLPMGNGPVIVSSPPYVDSMEKIGGIDPAKSNHIGGPHSQMNRSDTRYGTAPGQLGAMVVGSPPFADSVGSDDPDKRGGLFRDEKRRNDTNLTGTYGETEGQLGAMKAGAVIGSPPFEKSIPQQDKDFCAPHDSTGYLKGDYGSTAGQIGATQGDTFWAAARLIVEQCALLLPEGGAAIWVVKGYIKNGQYVDFPGQWQALCEACGFETVHVHRAMLVKKNGAQAGFDGGMVSKDVARKSFFRRLAERKGSPPIDFETVLCTRKLHPELVEGKAA